ncbi:MAG: hypothetical protein GWP69_15055 [Gammaproteobacteria bacterium]|nr:hypothetical protein [Gammaproteobacteria bacterium]
MVVFVPSRIGGEQPAEIEDGLAHSLRHLFSAEGNARAVQGSPGRHVRQGHRYESGRYPEILTGHARISGARCLPVTSTQVLFRREPRGLPVREDFDTVEAELPVVASGQFLVRGLYLSADPYMRILDFPAGCLCVLGKGNDRMLHQEVKT